MSTPRKIHPIDVFTTFEIRKKLMADIVPKIRKWYEIVKIEDRKRDKYRAHTVPQVQYTAYMPFVNRDFDHWTEYAKTAAFLCNHTISENDVGDREMLAKYIQRKVFPNQEYEEVRNFVQVAFETRRDCARILEELKTMIGEAKLISEKYHDLKMRTGTSGRKLNPEETEELKITPEFREALRYDY